MLLLDPRVDLPAIEALVGDYHVILDPAVILDAGEGEFDATVTRILRYEPHPITRGFNVITIFPMARPVRLDEAAMPPGMTGSYLAITEETAWGEVNMESFAVGSATREGEDIAPPLPVAATVLYTRVVPEQTEEQPEHRLLVIGDSDFVSNEFYGVFGNSDFFINCINFLSEDEDRITIRPNRGPGDRFFITAGQGRFIFTTSIILLPLCVILVGTTVMFRKRRA